MQVLGGTRADGNEPAERKTGMPQRGEGVRKEEKSQREREEGGI